MATLDHQAELDRAGANVESFWQHAWFFTRRYPLGAVGGLIVLIFIGMAIFAPWITSFDPTATNSKTSLAPPGGEHLLGADFMGRDLFSRIIWGARISLYVGIGSTVLGCFFGVVIGLLSGYYGGWLDLLTQRVIDIMQALPLLVMALLMAASLGPSLTNTIIAISIPIIPMSPASFDRIRWPCGRCPMWRRPRPSAWGRPRSPSGTCCRTRWRR